MAYYLAKYKLVKKGSGEREVVDTGIEYFPDGYKLLRDLQTNHLGKRPAVFKEQPLRIVELDQDHVIVTAVEQVTILSGIRQGYKIAYPHERILGQGSVVIFEKESFCLKNEPERWIYWADTPFLETQVDY